MQRSLGWVLVVVQFALLIVLVLVPRRAMEWPTTVLGAVLLVAGVILGFAAFRALGPALTPTPVPIAAAGLRTDGVYRRVRHPIYSAVLLLVAGYVIAVGSVWSLGVAVALLIFFWLKSRWEDRLLAQTYGESWRTWASATGSLIPRWRDGRHSSP